MSDPSMQLAAPLAGYSPFVQLLAVMGFPLGRERLIEFAGLVQGKNAALFSKKTREELELLSSQGQLLKSESGYSCAPQHRHAAYRAAVEAGNIGRWRDFVLHTVGSQMTSYRFFTPSLNLRQAACVARLAFCKGTDAKWREELLEQWAMLGNSEVIWFAFGAPFEGGMLDTVAHECAEMVAVQLLEYLLRRPDPSAHAAAEWGLGLLRAGKMSVALTWRLGELLLWQGRFEAVRTSIVGTEPNLQGATFDAAIAAMTGRYSEALEKFRTVEQALSPRGKPAAGRLPPSFTCLRIAAAIASGTPAAAEEARQLCRREGRADGLYRSSCYEWLDRAAATRLGEYSLTAQMLPYSPSNDLLEHWVAMEIAAWLGWRLDAHRQNPVKQLLPACAAAGYRWLEQELLAALAITAGHAPPPELSATLAAAFAAETAWSRAMTAIAALGERHDAQGAEPPADTRLVWMIMTSKYDFSVQAWEQKRNARGGWNRGKAFTLAKLQRLEPQPVDAQLCRLLSATSGYSLSREQVHRVLPALVGHPRVFIDPDHTTPVEIVAAEPELILERQGEGLRVRLETGRERSLHPVHDEYLRSGSGRSEADQPDPCLLIRDSATHARVVRFTPAHRRVAQLIGAGLDVPREGVDGMKRALESVAHLFAVHSDVETAISETPADATLRAELTPAGVGLRLRLAARPFGDEGPRYEPGEGGRRIVAEIKGERRAVLRDLEAERRAACQVQEALPLLAALAAAAGHETDKTFEWQIEDAQHCLELVESLRAAEDLLQIQWPADAKFRVSRSYRSDDLQLQVESQRDWFVVAGGLKLDDGSVLEMRRLIDFIRAGRGRYLPLGDAGFLALSDELRRRLDELARGGADADGSVRFPALAAGVLADALEGLQFESGAAWQARMELLREAEALQPLPPSTFQAELRAYQLDGYRWMTRLAHWRAGACLADDMGLGKTVQALALLLDRAAGGAALVIAPTSVCPNWLDEARRFAPTLNLTWFGAGSDRTEAIRNAGPFDVLICSYALLQQHIEGFAARPWRTVVLDEAQAIKNAFTKRAQAVLELQAEFRLATTGTPVENRLDELWMLMRFLNPGLLGSRERFNERFAAPIERRNDAAARAQLRRLIAPFVLRRTKSEVLTELPPRTEIVLSVASEPQERAFREALRQSALDAIADSSAAVERRRFQVLAELMRLRRACCDPSLVAPELGMGGAKLEAFAELALELAGNRHKALVFSQFVDFLRLLRDKLTSLGLSHQYLDGGTPAAERARAVKAFQAGEGDFFLISLRAGGFGLNLTAADYVIIADPWWNPAAEDQAAGRAHRMGQQRPVTVYRLVVKDSIEERIMDMHRAKRALAEGLFTGEEFGRALSVEELAALLREG